MCRFLLLTTLKTKINVLVSFLISLQFTPCLKELCILQTFKDRFIFKNDLWLHMWFCHLTWHVLKAVQTDVIFNKFAFTFSFSPSLFNSCFCFSLSTQIYSSNLLSTVFLHLISLFWSIFYLSSSSFEYVTYVQSDNYLFVYAYLYSSSVFSLLKLL